MFATVDLVGIDLPRRGVPLKDRPASTGAPPPGGTRPRTRHCWVATPQGERQGLVLAWSTTRPGSWVAYVIYVVTDAGEEGRAVQEWVPAERLRRASSA